MGVLNKIVIDKITAHWEDVAYALCYKIATVETIKRKSNQDPKKCCQELFKDWLTTNNGVAAGPKIWSTLIDKLRDVEELTVAREEIVKELGEIYRESAV